MAENHDWNRPKSDVTLEKVLEVTEIIVRGIQRHGGSWVGTINDVMQNANETDPEEYGTYLQAIDTASKLYKVQWKKAGRNGREYFMEGTDIARFYAERAKLSKIFEVAVDITITCSHCSTPTNYTITVKENR